MKVNTWMIWRYNNQKIHYWKDDDGDDCDIADEDNEDCYDNKIYDDDDKGGFVYIWIIMRYFEFLYV